MYFALLWNVAFLKSGAKLAIFIRLSKYDAKIFETNDFLSTYYNFYTFFVCFVLNFALHLFLYQYFLHQYVKIFL